MAPSNSGSSGKLVRGLVLLFVTFAGLLAAGTYFLRRWQGAQVPVFDAAPLARPVTKSVIGALRHGKYVVPDSGVLDDWNSGTCQHFYRHYLRDELELEHAKTVYVPELNIFLPSNEADRQSPGYPHEPSGIRRALTYEDLAMAQEYDSEKSRPLKGPVEAFLNGTPFYVRTPVRGVEIVEGWSPLGVRLITPRVRKSASAANLDVLCNGPFHCNGGQSQTRCIEGLGAKCMQATDRIDLAGYQEAFAFAFVRNPLERFMAAARSHMPRGPQSVEKQYKQVRELASKLRNGTGDPAFATQSYLLSGTTSTGEPIPYKLIAKVDSVSAYRRAWRDVGDAVAQDVRSDHLYERTDTSGSESAKAQLFGMARQDASLLCMVCWVYLQDYVCFDYQLPAPCCEGECVQYGLFFKDQQLEAASCSPPARAKAASVAVEAILARERSRSHAQASAAAPGPPAREFHVPDRGVLDSWNSAACRNFFRPQVQDLRPSRTTFVEEAKMFLPSYESHREHPSYPHPEKAVTRVLTYEDVVVPVGWDVRENLNDSAPMERAQAFNAWCMPYFIRTPVRATKIAVSDTPKYMARLVTPAVWKSTSSSTADLMLHAPFHSQGGFHKKIWATSCIPELGDFCKHSSATSLSLEEYERSFAFAFVRDPFDRFLAGVHEHGQWSGNMTIDMRAIRFMAKKVKRHHPHSLTGDGFCEYKTQSYLISGTTKDGDAIPYKFIAQVDTMDKYRKAWGVIGEAVGEDLTMKLAQAKANPSGSEDVKQRVRDSAWYDIAVVCSVCKVWIQDYACFNYTLPERCCNNTCASYGVEFPKEHLEAANCGRWR